MKTKWTKEIPKIKRLLRKGISLGVIGAQYNVSRQRMYQVLTKFGVETSQRKRDNFLRGKPPKVYWLNKMLSLKGFAGDQRTKLLETLLLPDVCPILGIPLNYDGEGEYRKDTSPSIDRINNSKAYTEDNIQVISFRANRIKNDGSAEELMKIAKYLLTLE